MASKKRIELLLTKSVENLGLVGDIVKVRMGYARNYLVPMGLAEIPTQEKIDALAEERTIALEAYEQKRSEQISTIEKLEDVVLTLTRSANDQGGLYGSVTQRDIADSLGENGFTVNTRAVRLHQAIRRIGEYTITIQFGSDLKADIEVQILPDRPLEDRDEMEFDDDGNLIIVEKTEQATDNGSQKNEEPITEESAETTES